MSKQRKDNWPVWKISLMIGVWAAVGIGLLIAAAYVSSVTPAATASAPAPATAPATPGTPHNPSPSPVPTGFGAGHLLLLLSLLAWAMAVVFVGWLVYKLYMRIPAWRRRQLFGRTR